MESQIFEREILLLELVIRAKTENFYVFRFISTAYIYKVSDL